MPHATHASENCVHCDAYGYDPRDRMSALGFGHCAHDIPAYYRSPSQPCRFNPPRFIARRPIGGPGRLSEALRTLRAEASARSPA